MIHGLDISQYQATTPPLGSVDFVFVKATEGNGFTDPKYHLHASDVRAAGKVLGAYHFGRVEVDGASQAAYFLSVVGSDTKLVALDIEGTHAITPDNARQWISAVKAAGKVAGVYHSLSGYPLDLGQDFNWVADWSATPPSVKWDFWQYTSSGTVPGFSGRLDLDAYNGTLDQLRALAGVAPAVPQPPKSLGPRPAGATGWLSVSGDYEVWLSALRRQARHGVFSAWATPMRLRRDLLVRPGYQILSGGYEGWRVFAGPAVRWHPAP